MSKCESQQREIGFVDLYNWLGAIGVRLGDFMAQVESDIEEYRRAKARLPKTTKTQKAADA